MASTWVIKALTAATAGLMAAGPGLPAAAGAIQTTEGMAAAFTPATRSTVNRPPERATLGAEPAAAAPDITPVKVAASPLGEGHAVYVRGSDGRVWWRTVQDFADPQYSTTWRPVPDTVGSGPDVVPISAEQTLLAARSTGNSLVVRWQDQTRFGPWQNLGGIITSAPALMVDDTDRIWVFARGADNGVWYRVRGGDGLWQPWQTIGGGLTSAPDPVANFGPRVFGRGLDGVLWARTFDGGVWQPWSRVGRAVTSASSTVTSDLVFQIQFYRGQGSRVFRASGDSEPTDIGGIATSAPDATHNGAVVAVRGADDALWVRVDIGGWTSLGGIAA